MSSAADSWALYCCALIQKATVFLCRLPAFTRPQIERMLATSETIRQEESEDNAKNKSNSDATQLQREQTAYWINCATSNRLKTVILIISYAIYCSKNLILTYTIDRLDDSAHDLDHYRANQASRQHKFACLETNCSRLGSSPASKSEPEMLAEDISLLPLTILCQPAKKLFVNELMVMLDKFGLLLVTVSAFYCFMHGCWLPIQQMLFPCSNLMIMFLVAPNITMRLVRARTRDLLADLAISLQNYRLKARYKLAPNILPGSRHANNLSTGKILQSSPFGADRQDKFKHLVSECMPTIRGRWWHKHMARSFCFAFLLASATILLVTISFNLIIQRYINSKRLLMSEYARNTRSANCSVWISGSNISATSSEPVETIEFEQISIRWTLMISIDALSFNMISCLSSVLLSSYYWALVLELELWLAELRLYFTAALVISRFGLVEVQSKPDDPLIKRDAQKWVAHHRSGPGDPFTIGSLRVKFINELRFKLNWIYSQIEYSPNVIIYGQLNSSQNDKIHLRFYLERADQLRYNSLDSNIQTLEQLYINFRLFIEHVQSLKPIIVVLLSYIYMFAFGLVLIGVYHARSYDNFTLEPLTIVALGWFLSIMLFIPGGNFHANSKKLQPIMWSIIAHLSASDNIRVKHIRLLFLKQLQIINSEGGLAFNAFGIRITYVNILQSIIWVSTILTIAAKI